MNYRKSQKVKRVTSRSALKGKILLDLSPQKTGTLQNFVERRLSKF